MVQDDMPENGPYGGGYGYYDEPAADFSEPERDELNPANYEIDVKLVS